MDNNNQAEALSKGQNIIDFLDITFMDLQGSKERKIDVFLKSIDENPELLKVKKLDGNNVLHQIAKLRYHALIIPVLERAPHLLEEKNNQTHTPEEVAELQGDIRFSECIEAFQAQHDHSSASLGASTQVLK